MLFANYKQAAKRTSWLALLGLFANRLAMRIVEKTSLVAAPSVDVVALRLVGEFVGWPRVRADAATIGHGAGCSQRASDPSIRQFVDSSTRRSASSNSRGLAQIHALEAWMLLCHQPFVSQCRLARLKRCSRVYLICIRLAAA